MSSLVPGAGVDAFFGGKSTRTLISGESDRQAICRAADGFHTISVVKTGGGKTTYLSGFMVLLQELDKLPPTHSLKQDLTRSFPKNPVTIVVYPTKGLEEEMEQTFNSLGIPSLAINEDTLKAARRRGEDLWKTAAHSDLRCLLLSPEQLASKQFSALITDKSEGFFFSRIVNLGIDEIHLILSWGSPHFRGAFLEVGNVLMRLPRGTTLIGLTATLAVGNDVERIMKVLGLQPGSFVFARRSNRRPELQFIFCIFGHGIQGWQFPDLKWIIDGSRKTIIYCRTISLAFRLNYNKKSRDMFVQNPETQILITTDALKVGNDFPNVEDAVSIDPATPEDVLQYGGRAGRKGIQSDPGPRSISYFTKSTLDRAKSVLNGKNQDPETVWESVPEDLGTDGEGKMTVGMARLLLAPCIMAEIDIQFGNPKNEVASPTLPKASSAPRASSGIPMAKRLNEKMRAYGHTLTPEALLPDDNIKRIFNDFAKIFADVEKILPYLNCFFKAYAAPLVEELKDLEKRFRAMSIGVEPDQEEDLATRYRLPLSATIFVYGILDNVRVCTSVRFYAGEEPSRITIIPCSASSAAIYRTLSISTIAKHL
ncbi:hypothetical protein MPER_13231 [Moniliophthora perniciosa FA553]|nr:hypothetical protein MPER_13231 [Moniliophthora perniciosa FA553]